MYSWPRICMTAARTMRANDEAALMDKANSSENGVVPSRETMTTAIMMFGIA
jgi:hypothetical protein